MDFKDSKTFKNLKKAFSGESEAHLKYQFYKSQLAKTSKDLEKHLDEIVHNEKEHGKIWFKLLHDGKLPDDVDNLLDAIKGEKEEYLNMYPEFAKVAFEEGYEKIGKLFEEVAKIEGQHAEEFSEILKNIQDEWLFKDEEEWGWICQNCGHIHYGKEAPEKCPVCDHPKKYFVRD